MLPRELDGRRTLRAFGRLGWIVVRVRGSHRILRHTDGRTFTLAFHGQIGRNSVKRALQEANVDDRDFETNY